MPSKLRIHQPMAFIINFSSEQGIQILHDENLDIT